MDGVGVSEGYVFGSSARGASLSEEFRYDGVGKPLSLAGIIVRLPQPPLPREMAHDASASKG